MSLTKPIQLIRDNFSFFGYDLSHLTDEQLEQGVEQLSKNMYKSYVTLDEATEAVVEFSRMINTKWCKCDCPEYIKRDGKYFCGTCDGAIECELCEDDNIEQAVTLHIDYYVCEKHESIAVDIVADR